MSVPRGLPGGEEEEQQDEEEASGEAQSLCPLCVLRRVSPDPGFQGRPLGWEGAQDLETRAHGDTHRHSPWDLTLSQSHLLNS